MHPTPHPCDSNTLAGCPSPFPAVTSVRIRAIVDTYNVSPPSANGVARGSPGAFTVTGGGEKQRFVIGSSDSKMIRCLVPRSCIRSPLISVIDPFANPTALRERDGVVANAEIYHRGQHRT